MVLLLEMHCNKKYRKFENSNLRKMSRLTKCGYKKFKYMVELLTYYVLCYVRIYF